MSPFPLLNRHRSSAYGMSLIEMKSLMSNLPFSTLCGLLYGMKQNMIMPISVTPAAAKKVME